MDNKDRDRVRFSLSGILFLTTLVSIAFGMMSFTDHGVAGFHLLFIILGWAIRRLTRCKLGGIIPALLGLDFLGCMSIVWIAHGLEDFMDVPLMFVASFFVIAGIFVLFVASPKEPFRVNHTRLGWIFLVALVAWWLVIPPLRNAAVAKRRILDSSANTAAAARAIALVEEVENKMGATPDKDTLAEMLSEPLPSVRWNGITQQIQFNQTSKSSFQLTYIDPTAFMFGDIITYDSSKPEAGWIRIPF